MCYSASMFSSIELESLDIFDFAFWIFFLRSFNTGLRENSMKNN